MTTVKLQEVACPAGSGGVAVRVGGYRWGCSCGAEHFGVLCPLDGSLAQRHVRSDVDGGWLRCVHDHWVCVRKLQPCTACRTGFVVGLDSPRLWRCEFCSWQELMEPSS